MMLKKFRLWAITTLAFAGIMLGATPLQAQAVPPLNPICWIADKNNPGVREGCKGHDWNWPHWGGGKSYDSPDRGCGGSDIYSQSWWMNANELSARNYGYLRSTQGYQWSELLLTNSVKNVRSFRRDTYTYYWRAQLHERVYYPNVGWMDYYRDVKTTAVTCDLNGHVT